MSTPIVRYRKKAIEVETIQWTGSNEADVQAFAGGPSRFYALDAEDRQNSDDPEATATVYDKLHSTWILVYTGQHIVRGVRSELYPIADQVLAETYDAVDGGAPDLHGVIYDTLVRTASDTGLKHAQIRQHLTEHLMAALAPLVPYREVWDASLPPGGRVCNVCGQSVESERCPEHAPTFFQHGRVYTRRTHGDLAEFDVRHIEPHPDGHQVAFGFYRRQPRTTWHPYTSSDFYDGWTDTTTGES